MQTESTWYKTDISTLVKGSAMAFIGELGRFGINFLYTLLTAWAINADLLGSLFLGLTILQVLQLISALGLNQGVIRYLAIYLHLKDPARAVGVIRLATLITFVSSTIFAIVLYVNSEWLALHLFNKPSLGLILRWLAASLPFEALSVLFFAALQGVKDIRSKVTAEIVVSLGLQIVLSLISIFLNLGLEALLIGYLISRIAGFGFAARALAHIIPMGFAQLKPIYEVKSLLSFSLPLLFTTLFNLLLGQNEIIILGIYFQGEEIAIYSIALKLALIGAIFLRSFVMIFSPVISELAITRDWDRLNSLYKVVTKWIFTLNFPWFIFMVFFAESILLLIGTQYASGAQVLIILCFEQLINSAVGTVGALLMMSGHPRLVLVNSIAMVILSICLGFTLIPRYGIWGAAVSNAVTIIVGNLLPLLEVFLLLKIHPYSRSYGKPFIAGIGAIGCTQLLMLYIPFSNHVVFLVQNVITFGFVYTIILVSLGIESSDKFVISAFMQRAAPLLKYSTSKRLKLGS